MHCLVSLPHSPTPSHDHRNGRLGHLLLFPPELQDGKVCHRREQEDRNTVSNLPIGRVGIHNRVRCNHALPPPTPHCFCPRVALHKLTFHKVIHKVKNSCACASPVCLLCSVKVAEHVCVCYYKDSVTLQAEREGFSSQTAV